MQQKNNIILFSRFYSVRVCVNRTITILKKIQNEKPKDYSKL